MLGRGGLESFKILLLCLMITGLKLIDQNKSNSSIFTYLSVICILIGMTLAELLLLLLLFTIDGDFLGRTDDFD